MKLSFHGAARTVTGSKHRLILNSGTQLLLDCGLFQGLGIETETLNAEFGFDPATISFVVLSHAHIDHSGLLPKLVKEGFTGRVYCTEATKELTEILLYDSADIQTHCHNESTALYSAEDVEKTMQQFQCVELNEWFLPCDEVKLLLTNAGHLVGSSVINLVVTEDGKDIRIMYSGDIGRYRGMLLAPPAECPQADYIILESTYGHTTHDIHFNPVENLLKCIKETCIQKKGKLVIPAFSVGRTQEILYTLNQLELEKRLPAIPYFVDSPLGHKATSVIKKHTGYFNERMQKILLIDDDPFLFEGLQYVDSTEDSKKLAAYTEPCVIISASGTADGGRVRHHIHSCLEDPSHTILMAGFCTSHTLGGKLLNGSKKISILGSECHVAAAVDKLEGMSAHGDQDDLLRFLGCQNKHQVKKIFLVHGEYLSQQEFSVKLGRKGFQNIAMPGMHAEIEIGIDSDERGAEEIAA